MLPCTSCRILISFDLLSISDIEIEPLKMKIVMPLIPVP